PHADSASVKASMNAGTAIARRRLLPSECLMFPSPSPKKVLKRLHSEKLPLKKPVRRRRMLDSFVAIWNFLCSGVSGNPVPVFAGREAAHLPEHFAEIVRVTVPDVDGDFLEA